MKILRTLAVATLFCCPRTATALPPRYSVVDLGPAPNRDVDGAKDINASGQVALIRDVQAYVWTNGVLAPLTGASANNGPLAINDIGDFVYGDHSRAVLWRNGIEKDLGTLEASTAYTFPFDVNNHSSVVGYTYLYSNNHQHGFIWENGIMRDIGAPVPTGVDVYAFAINDSGQVVGAANDHAYIWENEHFTDLGALSGLPSSQAEDVNQYGQAVGYSADWNALLQHPTLWKNGAIVDLGFLPGMTYGLANSISAQTQVVGKIAASYFAMDTLSHAFIWESGQIRDLNDMIGPNSGWIFRDAAAVNDSGVIVGWGYLANDRHSFMLTPLPEPTSFSLLAFGILLPFCRPRPQSLLRRNSPGQ